MVSAYSVSAANSPAIFSITDTEWTSRRLHRGLELEARCSARVAAA